MIAYCKVTHHVNSCLHTPSTRGALPLPNGQATIALCQQQLRWKAASLFKDGLDGDLWLIIVGAKTRDHRYGDVPLHDVATWREQAYGKVLAVAKITKVQQPSEARKSFPKNRSDTGD